MNADEYHILAGFNQWANRRIYDAVATLSDADFHKDMGAFFGSIHATLNHILVVDCLWVSRAMGEYHGIKGLDEILYEDLNGLRDAREQMDAQIIEFVDRLMAGEDGGLDKEVKYRLTKTEEKHTSPVRHILLTLFNHHTHHRGQVHCMLSQLGIKDPPALDIIFYLREKGED